MIRINTPNFQDPESVERYRKIKQMRDEADLKRMEETIITPQDVLDALETLGVEPMQSGMTRTSVVTGELTHCCAIGALQQSGKITSYSDPYISGFMEGFDGAALTSLRSNVKEFDGERKTHFLRGHQDGLNALKAVQEKYKGKRFEIDAELDPDHKDPEAAIETIATKMYKEYEDRFYQRDKLAADKMAMGVLTPEYARLAGLPSAQGKTYEDKVEALINGKKPEWIEQKLELATLSFQALEDLVTAAMFKPEVATRELIYLAKIKTLIQSTLGKLK
jgi:hypothetical protein